MAYEWIQIIKEPLKDTFFIYESKVDGCWIAHSLRTDQIGIGKDEVNALINGMKAVKDIIKLAEKEHDIVLFRDAPLYIIDRAKRAKTLPADILEKVYKKVDRMVKPEQLVPIQSFVSSHQYKLPSVKTA